MRRVTRLALMLSLLVAGPALAQPPGSAVPARQASAIVSASGSVTAGRGGVKAACSET